jgi:hypothetical protein
VKKILHNNIYRNDKISGTVKDSHSDGSSFSELSDGDMFMVEYILITRNKNLFSIILHLSVLRKSSLRDYWSWCPVIHTPHAGSV